MSQQPVSESVLTNNYRCATLAHVSRRFSGQVEIMPGVVGPEQIIDPRPALLTRMAVSTSSWISDSTRGNAAMCALRCGRPAAPGAL
jgi:hypothetical protein